MTTVPGTALEFEAISDQRALPSRSPLRLVVHQLRFDLLSLLRNRQARFFTLAMPAGFLLLFCAIFGNGTLRDGGHTIRESTYYVASLTTFGIVDAAFMTLGVALVEIRESGIFRRRQATPQPSWIIVASRALTTLLVSMSTAAVLLLIGRVAYGASTPLGALPVLVVSVTVGSVAFCCLGFAITGYIRSVQSAQPVVMGAAMPLFFISGVFVPWPFIPRWLQHVAEVFPIRQLSQAILAPITSQAGQSSWRGTDLLIVALWGAAGLVVALRSFKWAPQEI